jgi:rhodanese-related sulfurtransferase
MRFLPRHGWLAVMAAIMGMVAGPALVRAGRPVVINSLQAYDLLQKDPSHTFLIDVRTRAEYQFNGHPTMAYNVPWRFFTTNFAVKGARRGGQGREGENDKGRRKVVTGYQLSPRPNPRFVAVIRSLFKPTDRLLVISARGGRSAEAARALLQAGFKRVHNVADGYFGPAIDPRLPAAVRRLAVKYSHPRPGRTAGWIYWRLPRTFSIDPKFVYPPDLHRLR